MKVFISCLIRGFEEYREQTVSAARSLGHEVIRAEDFPASTSTPQAACLAGVRQADVVVLVMGARYGYVQPSGHSATHEEYREARGNKTVLLFVEDGMTMEPAQQTFLNEVRGWDTGHFYKLFSTSDDLREKVTRALHDHELSTAAGSVDEDEMLERATAAVPNQRGWGQTQLTVVVAGGPRQQVVRPAELDADRLGSTIQREAFFSEHALLDRTAATEVRIRDSRLIVEQQNALIGVDELGTIRMAVPAMRSLRSTGNCPLPSRKTFRRGSSGRCGSLDGSSTRWIRSDGSATLYRSWP